MKTTHKRIALAGAVILVVGVTIVLKARDHGVRADEAALPSNATARVSLSTAELTSVPQYLDATGTVKSQYEAPIATKVQGRVLQVFVRQGDRVRRGQPLLQLDARDLDAAVAQAAAGVRSASVGYDNAKVAASMEQSMADARIAQAQAVVGNAQAALQAARARSDMVQSGPRHQERTQAALAVAQAQSGSALARANLDRIKSLYDQGAIAKQQLDTYQSQYDVAKAQVDSAREAQSIADEGSRSEDIRTAKEGVLQAEAGLSQARAGLRQARASAKQADVRRADIRGAQAQVGQGRAALEMAQVTRDYATIAAPFDGVVTRRSVDPGALASPGVPLLTLQGGAQRLESVIPEGALASIRLGQAVPVELDALSGRTITGKVVEIAPQGDVSSHTFVVKVQLPADRSARSGMFGRARFRTGESKQILVPNSAVSTRDGLSYVMVVGDDSRARLRLVTAGTTEGGRTPILSGLNAGERVVTAGEVNDGQAVTSEN